MSRIVVSKPASTLTVVAVGAVVLSLCMGMRQSLGLFLRPVTQDMGVSTAAFAFALALQNLVWGIAQPVLGLMGDRYGARPVLILSGLVYAAGLFLMAAGGPFWGLDVGAGLLLGGGIAGTGFGVILGAVSRAVRPEQRVQTLGLVAAAGSIATLVFAPLAQFLIGAHGWQTTVLAFAGTALAMTAIGGLIGGKPAGADTRHARIGTALALRAAGRHPGFMAMTAAFFACGFQLAFITTHLPAFLALCGVAPSVGATALGVIGIANAIGSYLAGILGARYSQKRLLALIYLFRTLAIGCFLAMPVTAGSTLLFAAAMGFIWLSVVPLVSGLIGRMFGLNNFNTLFGIAFLSHQLGSFGGAWLGGVTYDLSGSYAIAWAAMIAIGALAFVLQWFMRDEPAPPSR